MERERFYDRDYIHNHYGYKSWDQLVANTSPNSGWGHYLLDVDGFAETERGFGVLSDEEIEIVCEGRRKRMSENRLILLEADRVAVSYFDLELYPCDPVSLVDESGALAHVEIGYAVESAKLSRDSTFAFANFVTCSVNESRARRSNHANIYPYFGSDGLLQHTADFFLKPVVGVFGEIQTPEYKPRRDGNPYRSE